MARLDPIARGLALGGAMLAASDLLRAAQGLPTAWWLGLGDYWSLRLALGGLLGAYAIRPQMARSRRIVTVIAVGLAAAVAARDALERQTG